jgi:hypothetical protein
MPKIELSIVSGKQALTSNELARQWLVKFAEVCQKDFSSALAGIWAEQLSDLDPELLNRSCDRLMKKWTSGFLPVPGNIRELAEQELRLAELQRLREQNHAELAETDCQPQRPLAPPAPESPIVPFEVLHQRGLKYAEEIKRGAEDSRPKPAIRAALTVRPSVHSLDEQKKILRSRGYLNDC